MTVPIWWKRIIKFLPNIVYEGFSCRLLGIWSFSLKSHYGWSNIADEILFKINEFLPNLRSSFEPLIMNLNSDFEIIFNTVYYCFQPVTRLKVVWRDIISKKKSWTDRKFNLSSFIIWKKGMRLSVYGVRFVISRLKNPNRSSVFNIEL